MAARRHLVFVVVGALSSLGATYPTTNFVVEAPTAQIAQQVGQYAEYYRKQKAMEWLGQEMAPWPERCPLKVHVTMSGPGGATSFAYDRGRVLGQHMHIEGPLDRLVASVLPHEVTHTVFAYYFRRPLPRWADEGGAVLSEDDIEKERHDKLVRQILNTPGRMIPLRRLFALQEYPGDVMVLYAEGFSVANFLVMNSNRQIFLGFVAAGMSYGWDYAAKTYYRYNSVEELEESWLAYLRSTKRQPPGMLLAQNTTTPGATVDTTHRVIVRQTVPPTVPAITPVYRGRAEEGVETAASGLTASRPGYLPDYNPSGPTPSTPTAAQNVVPQSQWQVPGAATAPASPQITLGAPQPVPGAAAGQAVPATASPVGYPR